jgi:magnesium-transporting ATPase (P-type)
MSARDPIDEPWLLDVDVVLRHAGADVRTGLTAGEAAARLDRVGPNRLSAAPPEPTWHQLLAQLADPLIYLLLAAVVVSAVAWMLDGADDVPFEVIVIVTIIAANAVLGFVQERRAEAAVAALQRMAAPTAGVLRDGRPVRVATEEIVPGDVLLLAEGDAVSADARLVDAAALTVIESSLTGESEPVVKSSAPLAAPAPLGGRTNMVFNGTSVARGRATAVVTATGMATEMGRIAGLLERTVEDRTPLQREIDRVGRLLGIAVIAITVVVSATILLTSDLNDARDVVDVLLVGVSLAVAAVPEGLPAVLSVVLALGVQRMAAQHAIVKKLSSVETLGSASIICTDKTGTLTENQMTIERIVTRAGDAVVTGAGYRPDGEILVDGRPPGDGASLDEIRAVLGGGSLANDATLVLDEGEWQVHGDPSEAAFLVAERKLGITSARQARFERVGEIPFSSDRKLMTTVDADAERGGRLVVVTKGAPDVLLARCSHELAGTTEVELTSARREEILASVEHLAEEAMRTLAVAYRTLDTTVVPDDEASLESDLVLAGVVGIADPPRPEAADAVRQARDAGIRVIMITGDHPRTARRIATDLGIIAPGADERAVVTGTELEALDGDGLAGVAATASVFARVAPVHKLRIVGALKARGHVVAMTGDGVNDAPALRMADIGVAMGRAGSDVAKEAAHMVLADDNFATIVTAVREGRGIFANIQRFLRYLLSSNIGEVLTMFLGVVAASVIGLDTSELAVAAPLLATQILWINLLTDTAPALALGVDPPPRDVMAHPPRRLSERVIGADMWRGVIVVGTAMAVATLLTMDIWLPGGLAEGSSDFVEARTAGFTVLVLAQLFNCLNARSEHQSAFVGLFHNRLLWGAIALSATLQVAVVSVPFLNEAFDTTPLSAGDWTLCVLMASSVLWVAEVHKVVLRRRYVKRPSALLATGAEAHAEAD